MINRMSSTRLATTLIDILLIVKGLELINIFNTGVPLQPFHRCAP